MRFTHTFVFKVILIVFAFIVISSCTHSRMRTKDTNLAVSQVGEIRDRAISEASGIAVSRLNRNVLWINNDSGNRPYIYAVDPKGNVKANVHILGVKNIDWEDLAYFEKNGKSYIVLADVGDNGQNRPLLYLSIIEEPDLTQYKGIANLTVTPKWTISFTYPDGAHDVESVAVDSRHNKILLLSKRNEPQELFELPLHSGHNLKAKRLGVIPPLPKPQELHFRILDLLGLTQMPTGMDISPDGRQLAVMTYGDAFLFSSKGDGHWLNVLNQKPKEINLPELKQGEAIGFDYSGKHLYITTEKLPSPILRVDIDKLSDED